MTNLGKLFVLMLILLAMRAIATRDHEAGLCDSRSALPWMECRP